MCGFHVIINAENPEIQNTEEVESPAQGHETDSYETVWTVTSWQGRPGCSAREQTKHESANRALAATV